ncbi:MAG TPA: 4-(cytidine 5'-diphospho)-2-C-methyl-D-erythritol kinase [Balneolales bacterium]|nr:4-(cytidine 5'-diphospho)-2-C-methyl-D-erythritol kinase [Balneolales bacterium]
MTPSSLTVTAPAKINLYFAVLNKRRDGYHEVETVMQKIDLVDRLTFTFSASGFKLTCSDSRLPVDDTNLVAKAANSFFGFTGIASDVLIHLEKNIPIAAGLGGGSSDAGICLVGLNTFFKAGLNENQLLELARPLGADVPFFVSSWPAACATGIGNELRCVEPVEPCWIVLVNPGIYVSTKWAYDNFRLTRDGNPYNVLGRFKLTVDDNLSKFASLQKADTTRLFNDLEKVTIEKHPVLQEIKDQFLADGAKATLMSGSGATVFGVFEQRAHALKSKDQFSEHYSAVYLAEPVRY